MEEMEEMLDSRTLIRINNLRMRAEIKHVVTIGVGRFLLCAATQSSSSKSRYELRKLFFMTSSDLHRFSF